MIVFNSIDGFVLANGENIRCWLESVVVSEHKTLDEINYIFCNDEYLHKLNVEFLNHDTLTDVISFDYTSGSSISGDIYISVERVRENALDFDTSFVDELNRVMVHGLLHFCGYKDKCPDEVSQMRSRENLYLSQR